MRKIGSKWSRVRQALRLNRPRIRNTVAADNDDDQHPRQPETVPLQAEGARTSAPPTAGSGESSRNDSSRPELCSICLQSMRHDEAIFRAQCQHSFHFNCIATNVEHGNQICPICRAKWDVVPFASRPEPPRGGIGVDWFIPRERRNIHRDTVVIRELPPRSASTSMAVSSEPEAEPAIFNDDERLDPETASARERSCTDSHNDVEGSRKVRIETYTEVSAVPRLSWLCNFNVCVHLQAPGLNSWQDTGEEMPSTTHVRRHAPVDLVTILDVSGSMCGTKIALLKKAMGFVIRSLGPKDRLSVISFSSNARRLFPLRRMTQAGQQQALQAVNALVANGGTNITEALRKGIKVMEDRVRKNPITSVILLSDGQDTYTFNYMVGSGNPPNYRLLVPLTILPDELSGFKMPVHTFGFGIDHDASALHAISDLSGGTFSFIEAQQSVQDAFAQCIGGLLSVVAKDLQVKVECTHPEIQLGTIRAGNYLNRIISNQRVGTIDVGNLYADEERDFLVSVNVPAEISGDEMSLLSVSCEYNNPLMDELVNVEALHVIINRKDATRQEDTSIQVDRQINRIRAAEAMAQAQTAAENGDLSVAVSILGNARAALSETVSARAHDGLCMKLDAELQEMQERLESKHSYETSGRAYLLSGLSSHSWQRATARGDSTWSTSRIQTYQTPTMTEMITHSRRTFVDYPTAPARGQIKLRWTSPV